jgi:hypothetical protein
VPSMTTPTWFGRAALHAAAISFCVLPIPDLMLAIHFVRERTSVAYLLVRLALFEARQQRAAASYIRLAFTPGRRPQSSMYDMAHEASSADVMGYRRSPSGPRRRARRAVRRDNLPRSGLYPPLLEGKVPVADHFRKGRASRGGDSDHDEMRGEVEPQNMVQMYAKNVLLSFAFLPRPLIFVVAPSNFLQCVYCRPTRKFSHGQNEGPPWLNGR